MSDNRRRGAGDEEDEQPVEGFYRLTDMTARIEPPRSYRGPEVEIEFGLFYKGARGTAGEVFVTWERAGSRDELTPRLYAYGDGFAALWRLRRVLRALSTRPNITPDDLCARLRRLGFTDFTVSETPWIAHKPTGCYYRIHESVFEGAPMSADESIAAPDDEESFEVDYDAATELYDGAYVERLRAIEIALRSGASSLDALEQYMSKGSRRDRTSAEPGAGKRRGR
ncbi:MAG: hypothetical protein ACJ74Q_15080 [Pyrinomonadaceae bacterium]